MLILFTIEDIFNTQFLEKLSNSTVNALVGENATQREGSEFEGLNAVIEPVVKRIVQLNKTTLKAYGQGPNNICADQNCRSLWDC